MGRIQGVFLKMIINGKIISSGLLVYIYEKGTGIRYHKLSEKGDRPFLLMNILSRKIVLIPISSNFPAGFKKYEINIKNNISYLRCDLPLIISKKKFLKLVYTNHPIDLNKKVIDIIWGIHLINKNKIKHILHEINKNFTSKF